MTGRLHPAEAVTYELVDRVRYRRKAALIGAFVGIAGANLASGSLVEQVAAAAVLATAAGAIVYYGVLALADWYTRGTGRYRVVLPARSARRRSDERTLDDPRTSGRP